LRKNWTDDEIGYLLLLAESGHTLDETAQQLKRTKIQVTTKVARLRRHGAKLTFFDSKIKYPIELKEQVLKYYQTHSFAETARQFSLKPNELKSLLTRAYGKKELKLYRKDNRCKRKWDTQDLVVMLKLGGLKRRDAIAKQLGRSKSRHHSVKDRLRELNISSRQINGLTLSQFHAVFGAKPKHFITTKAGPPGRPSVSCKSGCCRWKIIPYVEINRMIKDKELRVSKTLRLAFEAMAMFQRWIWNDKNLSIEKIKKGMSF